MTLSQSLFHLIYHREINFKTYPAILSPGKQAMTFGELNAQLRETALQLSQMGFRPGDRLAVVLPNGPEMATAFLAVSAVSTCAPLNPSLLAEDFKFCLADFRIKALIVGTGMGTESRLAADDLGIPVIELVPDQQVSGKFSLNHELDIDTVLTEPVYSGVDDIALVLHTSGTTSRPKIVPLTHRNIVHSVQNIIDSYDLTPADCCLNMMPLFHIHGLVGALAASLVAGGSVVCAPGFSPDNVLDWFDQFAPTWYTAVPTLHQAILEEALHHPGIGYTRKLRFIRSCSSPLSSQLATDLENHFNVPVLEAYGMTEAAHQIASNPLPPMPRKLGSVGKATGTSMITIRGSDGQLVAEGELGEICIQGENVTAGYENNPFVNAESIQDGWLSTGDLGYIDEEGYLFIQGRLKEFINRAGEKISPREIDEVLLQHPGVKQAVAFAVPHPSLGEDIAAVVVLKPGSSPSRRELHQFSAQRLPEHKIPRLIVFVPEIPKGPTGKLQRIGLSEKLRQELEDASSQERSGVVKPRTPEEAKILAIWQQVLEHEDVGIQDDFLSLGIDSIKIAQILMLIQKEFNVNVSLREFYFLPTIELMAENIRKLLGRSNN